MIIGIDLGTTFSVLAVGGQVELTEGYPPPTYLEELDVTIIPDPFGNDVIPSAVWEAPEDPGTLIVGTEARDRALEGQAPILFSKRNIGTDLAHRLEGREYSAREVAQIVLSYLKDIAEQALGERVDQAIITHPAFFEGSMMRETAEAALAAGFDFDQEKNLMMEPTAAALAYTGTDPRDPMRLLTYDLGGGTFDVTVLERRGGVVTIKAFGGNRLLGGYTFDRRLAQWLYERMRANGVRITVDEEDAGRHAVWTRLLQIAEDTKHRLANARTDRVPVHIRAQLTDDDGRTVTLLDSINRLQYTELIQDLLDETIDGDGGAGESKGCDLILAEAGLTIDQIDEILLVGGSTWGPWVAETFRRKWGREARLLEPDRIVAAGAALQAASLPVEVRGTGCTVHLEVEPRVPQESIIVAGRVETESTAGLVVALTDDAGNRYVATPDDDGRFHFEDVELHPRSITKFVLTAGEGEHRNLAEHHFEVEQVAEDAADFGTTAGVLTVLPKPLFIEVADGMEPLAEEGATLPARREVEFQRINDYDTIEIRLFQERDPIGSVLISDVPSQATRGSKVNLALEISRSNRIEGRATVHTRAGTVIREAPVQISIPLMEIPPLSELQEELAGLEAELEERLVLETEPNVRMSMRAEGDRLRRKVRRFFESPVPDRQEIWLVLRALDRVVRPPRDEMNPSLAHFESVALRVREALSLNASDPYIQAKAKQVSRLEKEGRAAHARRHTRRWAHANDGLRNLLVRLERPDRTDQSDELPHTDVQKMIAVMQLDQVRQELRTKEAELMDKGDLDLLRRRADQVRTAIDAVQAMIEQIDDETAPRAAGARIQMVMQKLGPISEDIRLLNIDLGRTT